MKLKIIKYVAVAGMIVLGIAFSGGLAVAASTNSTKLTSEQAATAAAKQKQETTSLITAADQEIQRRITNLKNLDCKIMTLKQVSKTEQNSLNSQVQSEIITLGGLKTSVDGQTSLATAQAAAEGIITEYQTYNTLVPKINVIKTSDDQQIAENNLSSISEKDVNVIGISDPVSVAADLSVLNTDVEASKQISSNIEQKALNVSLYNPAGHHLLSQYNNRLEIAQQYLETATKDASVINKALN